MNAEIIAIGSELLLGQIANTNAQYLSEELAYLGVNVFYHTTVGDNKNRLKLAIEQAKSRSDLIIFTGGLGPTKDDLTKETVAEILHKQLVTDESALERIEDFFKKTNRKMSENNRKQAIVIEGSDVLSNDAGMAPGMAVKHEGKAFMLFPGPPRELKTMFKNYGQDYIVNLLDKKEYINSRVLRYFGIGESQLETDIIDLIDGQSNPTIAPLAAEGEVTLRLTAKHESSEETIKLLDELESKINKRVGDYFYGYGDTSLAETLFNKLKKQNQTIASAESLTGGLFSELLTRFNGSSSVMNGGVVCYTNEIKQQILDVNPKIIEQNGAVSRECAEILALNVRQKFNSDIGISFTGVAGPTESEGKPVGTVYVGISNTDETVVHKLTLVGTRLGIRDKSVKYGCFYLLQSI